MERQLAGAGFDDSLVVKRPRHPGRPQLYRCRAQLTSV